MNSNNYSIGVMAVTFKENKMVRFFCFVFCVCTSIYSHMHHSTHEEIRGQPSRVTLGSPKSKLGHEPFVESTFPSWDMSPAQ